MKASEYFDIRNINENIPDEPILHIPTCDASNVRTTRRKTQWILKLVHPVAAVPVPATPYHLQGIRMLIHLDPVTKALWLHPQNTNRELIRQQTAVMTMHLALYADVIMHTIVRSAPEQNGFSVAFALNGIIISVKPWWLWWGCLHVFSMWRFIVHHKGTQFLFPCITNN